MRKIILINLWIMLFSTQFVIAQQINQSPVDFTATLKTNHLWRGLVITDKPMTAVQTTIYLDKKRIFSAGFWGGMASANESDGTHYKEIDYFIQYSNNGFTLGLWDLFNTRGVEEPDIWNYKKEETGHLLDLRTAYTFNQNFPLRVEANILLYGSGDTERDGNGNNGSKQRYSSYVELSYPLYQSQSVDLKGFAGVGFALNGDTHLYGDGKNSFDIVNIGITASKTLKINKWHLPFTATTLWNPSKKLARIQLAIDLF